MEFKYPYVKRPLKKNEADALLYFGLSLLQFGITTAIVISMKQIPPQTFVGLTVIYSAGVGLICLVRGYDKLKIKGV